LRNELGVYLSEVFTAGPPRFCDWFGVRFGADSVLGSAPDSVPDSVLGLAPDSVLGSVPGSAPGVKAGHRTSFLPFESQYNDLST